MNKVFFKRQGQQSRYLRLLLLAVIGEIYKANGFEGVHQFIRHNVFFILVSFEERAKVHDGDVGSRYGCRRGGVFAQTDSCSGEA